MKAIHLQFLLRGQKERAAFSLLELLCVMAVISILAVTATQSIRSSLEGYNLTGAADMVRAELLLAKQTALSRNMPVEVRFYKYTDITGDKWRLMALLIPAAVSGNSSDEWITSGRMLPGNVVMEDSSEYSTVLSKALPLGSDKVAPWTALESSNAPRILQGKSYVGFLFESDGSTNLPNGQPWCLTLKNLQARPSGTGPTANYVSLVIDAATGSARSFQP